jgi:hypothetical protein
MRVASSTYLEELYQRVLGNHKRVAPPELHVANRSLRSPMWGRTCVAVFRDFVRFVTPLAMLRGEGISQPEA